MELSFLLIFYLNFLITLSGGLFCSDFVKIIRHEFYPLRHCQRSNKSIVGLNNFESVEECAKFAVDHRGLAFNYGDLERGKINLFNLVTPDNKTLLPTNRSKSKNKDIIEEPEEYYNCQVLGCPEFTNFSSMINDTRFDYYSLYTSPPPPVNATCLPTIGMFLFYEKVENFTKATNTCIEVGGTLSHILSETRTNSISKLLFQYYNNTHQQMAYVGLNRTEESQSNNDSNSSRNITIGRRRKRVSGDINFVTSAGEPIDCFKYRAWAPGHPQQSSCVALTIEKSWKSIDCRQKLPFVCEILTSGPNNTINLSKKCSTKKSNNKIYSKF